MAEEKEVLHVDGWALKCSPPHPPGQYYLGLFMTCEAALEYGKNMPGQPGWTYLLVMGRLNYNSTIPDYPIELGDGFSELTPGQGWNGVPCKMVFKKRGVRTSITENDNTGTGKSAAEKS